MTDRSFTTPPDFPVKKAKQRPLYPSNEYKIMKLKINNIRAVNETLTGHLKRRDGLDYVYVATVAIVLYRATPYI